MRRRWPLRLFRRKHTGDLNPNEFVWQRGYAYPETADGPYRVERVEPECPGQVYVRIVGMEQSGVFGIAWGEVLVPKYR